MEGWRWKGEDERRFRVNDEDGRISMRMRRKDKGKDMQDGRKARRKDGSYG